MLYLVFNRATIKGWSLLTNPTYNERHLTKNPIQNINNLHSQLRSPNKHIGGAEET